MKKTILAMTLVALSNVAFASGDGAHWGYEGAEAPEHWGTLHPDYALCSSGKNQTPIDIKNTLEAEKPLIKFNYQDNGTEVINNGHTIQVNFQPGSSMVYRGTTYHLKQFHLHNPSENTIDGKSFPMEAHLVHADDKGNLAVVGVMFEIGKANPAITNAWSKMPEKAGGKEALAFAVNAKALLPTHKDYYRFNGSLTTPPCSEGVTWIVMKNPMTISWDQLQQFAHVMEHPNNRPIQPVNSRPILR
jgi:carbonic anhydrase